MGIKSRFKRQWIFMGNNERKYYAFIMIREWNMNILREKIISKIYKNFLTEWVNKISFRLVV